MANSAGVAVARRRMAGAGVSVAVFLACLELGLRVAPQAIPLDLLEQFEPAMRSAIASRRKLTTKKDTVLVPRHDGGPADRMWVYRPGAEVHWTFDEPGITNTVRVDDAGFCNPVADAHRKPAFDVVTLGDSFTFCTTVDPVDTWSNRFAELSGLDTFNLGQPGRGPHEYVALFEHFGASKSPRFVVMNIYEGNDFRDAYFFHEAAMQAAASRTSGDTVPCPFDTAAACNAFLALKHGAPGRRSYAYNLLSAIVWRLREAVARSEIDFQYVVRFADGSQVGMNSRNGDRDEVEFARQLTEGRLSTALFDDALERFVALGDRRGFVPVVLYTPSAYTAYEGMATFDDATIEATMRGYSQTLRAYFAARADELGYTFHDLTTDLQGAASRSSADDLLYFRTNVHLTAAGHRVVAGRLADLIADLR